MTEFNLFINNRRKKQIIIAMAFIAIISFGWFYPLLGFFIPLCMFLGLFIGFLRGRKWCDWFCPRGCFYDSVVSLASVKKRIPVLFKNIYWRISILLLLMSFMGLNLLRLWFQPDKIGMLFMGMLAITTIIGVILGLTFHQRSWCSFCPIGTVVYLTGRNHRPLKINSANCIECKLCAKVCPLQLSPYKSKGNGIQIVKEPDCLSCGCCVYACPKKALLF